MAFSWFPFNRSAASDERVGVVSEVFGQIGNGLGRDCQLIKRDREVVAQGGVGAQQATEVLHTRANFRQRNVRPRKCVRGSVGKRIHTIVYFLREEAVLIQGRVEASKGVGQVRRIHDAIDGAQEGR